MKFWTYLYLHTYNILPGINRSFDGMRLFIFYDLYNIVLLLFLNNLVLFFFIVFRILLTHNATGRVLRREEFLSFETH